MRSWSLPGMNPLYALEAGVARLVRQPVQEALDLVIQLGGSKPIRLSHYLGIVAVRMGVQGHRGIVVAADVAAADLRRRATALAVCY